MKQITLPSGKKAKIQDGKGYHLLQAQRKSKNTDEIPYALIAELAEFEGQKLPYEDILQFPLNDVSTLLNAFSNIATLFLSLSYTFIINIFPRIALLFRAVFLCPI